MGRYPTGPTACVDDPTCKVRINSMRDIGPVIIFAFWGIVGLVCGVFQLWKFMKLKKAPLVSHVFQGKSLLSQEQQSGLTDAADRAECSRDSNNEELRMSIDKGPEVQFTGYRETIFGEICYFLFCLTSFQWLSIYIVILVDTYNGCQVGSIDNLCFYGNNFIFGTYELNAKVFFTVWWLSAIWFTTWVINKGRVHNWFRMPCKLSEATVVYVWAQDEHEVLSVNVFFLVHTVRHVKNIFTPPEKQGHFQTIAVQKTKTGLQCFLFQGQRYLILNDGLQRAQLKVGDTFSKFYEGASGLTTVEAEKRLEQVGFNEIPFKPEPMLYIIFDELFTLFHVYQLIMYMLMFWNSYLFVASLLASIVLISASITIYNRHNNQVSIAKITAYITEADVLRSGTWSTINSRELVPGDVIKVKSSWVLPCDLLILQGSCVCNESSLTGESMPVQKYAAPNSHAHYMPEGRGALHTLFSGTEVLQAGTKDGEDVIAIVNAAGMETSKGEILSSILYPEKMLFKYDEELPVVVVLLLLYAIVCFSISIYFQNHTGAQSIWVTKWIYCMAIINQIMSPLLPVALEVGQLHAVERLKGRGVFCLNPKRIAIAGKIRLFCFDKTGTLTKEGLDFIGVQSLVSPREDTPSFGILQSLERGDAIDSLTLDGLATCHAVTKFGDQFVGNQVEVKMFSSVRWELLERPNEPPTVSSGSKFLKIVKRNEFEHARTTMSVIIQDGEGQFHIYCKGSFEKIHDLSSSSTLPENYMEVARGHALEGCYVLGLSHRALEPGLSLQDVLALSRDEVESELDFVGLILFRNELKHDSQKAIEALKAGEVRPVMVTGDNAQCGHYIAKECGMVANHVRVMLGDVHRDGSVSWSSMSADKETTSFTTEELLREHLKGLEGGILELAVTGKAFNALRRSELMDKLLFFTRIYARFTPADKVQVVDMHRAFGLIVGMCGDGGNDCGALRAAHAGIALSEAEASVVSPFTSRDKSVVSVVDLLREGRGALHTSFACYKFLIMYGLMFSVFKLCCYWYGIIPCQMDFIFIDGVAVLSLGYAMTLSYPEDKLGKVRPTSSLLGPINVGSVVGVWVINFIFLVSALLFMTSQPGYIKWPAKYSHGASWWTLGDNWESTVLFFVMYFQFITAAFVFTFGASFRKNVLFNWVLLVTYGTLVIFMSVLLLAPASHFTGFWHVASEQFNPVNATSPVWMKYQEHGGLPSPAMSLGFRYRLWWIILSNIIIVFFWQKVVAEGPVAAFLARRFPSRHRPKFLL